MGSDDGLHGAAEDSRSQREMATKNTKNAKTDGAPAFGCYAPEGGRPANGGARITESRMIIGNASVPGGTGILPVAPEAAGETPAPRGKMAPVEVMIATRSIDRTRHAIVMYVIHYVSQICCLNARVKSSGGLMLPASWLIIVLSGLVNPAGGTGTLPSHRSPPPTLVPLPFLPQLLLDHTVRVFPEAGQNIVHERPGTKREVMTGSEINSRAHTRFFHLPAPGTAVHAVVREA